MHTTYNIDELMNLLLRKRAYLMCLCWSLLTKKIEDSRIQQPTLNFKQQKMTWPFRCGYAENLQLICVGHTNHQEKPPHKKKNHLLFLLRLWPHILVQLKNLPIELQNHSPSPRFWCLKKLSTHQHSLIIIYLLDEPASLARSTQRCCPWRLDEEPFFSVLKGDAVTTVTEI